MGPCMGSRMGPCTGPCMGPRMRLRSWGRAWGHIWGHARGHAWGHACGYGHGAMHGVTYGAMHGAMHGATIMGSQSWGHACGHACGHGHGAMRGTTVTTMLWQPAGLLFLLHSRPSRSAALLQCVTPLASTGARSSPALVPHYVVSPDLVPSARSLLRSDRLFFSQPVLPPVPSCAPAAPDTSFCATVHRNGSKHPQPVAHLPCPAVCHKRQKAGPRR
eukprot:358895-Chlamydomonas_euryale.AAC.2